MISNGYTGSPSFIAIDPKTPSTVYAAGFNGGLFKTTNGGANWTSLNPGLGGAIAIDPVNTSILYVSSAGAVDLFRSTDGGNTFTALRSAPNSKYFAVVNPVTPTILYGAGNVIPEAAFISKLSPSGTSLVYSTLLGGGKAASNSSSTNDEAWAIAVDASGSAYITGATWSSNFPVASAY